MAKFDWKDEGSEEEFLSWVSFPDSGLLVGYDSKTESYYFSYYNDADDSLSYMAQEDFSSIDEAKEAAEEWWKVRLN